MWQKVEDPIFNLLYLFALKIWMLQRCLLERFSELCSLVQNKCPTCNESGIRICSYIEVCICVPGLSRETSISSLYLRPLFL